MEQSKPRAYAYIRMSTEKQLDGDSLRRQAEAARTFAAKLGLELDQEFPLQDIGLSGFTGANITSGDLGRFLTAIKERKIAPGSYLLVESMDRLTRLPLSEAQLLFLQIINSGINLGTIDDGRIYKAGTNEISDFIVPLLGMSRGHEESKRKSDLVGKAWAEKRENIATEKLTKICPAWLKLSPDRTEFHVLRERANVIRQIFEECAAGIGIYTITKRLNERKVPAFQPSNGWHNSYVAKILANKAVLGRFQPHKRVAREQAGEARPGETVTPAKGKKSIPDGPAIEGYYPRIIEDALFYRAQASRTERDVRSGGKGRGRKGKWLTNLFSQLLRCEYCERRMLIEDKGPKPKGGTYLVCDGVKRGLGCKSARWPYDQFEASFLSFVRELDLDRILASDRDAIQRAALDQEIASIEGELKSKRDEQETNYRLYLQTQTKFAETKIKENEARLDELTATLELKQAQRSQLAGAVTRFYDSKTEIKALLERFREPDQAEDIYKLRSQIASRLRAIVDTVRVAASGTVPRVEEWVASLKKQRPLPRREIAYLARQLTKERTRARFFTVMFKNGWRRRIVPDPNDPLRFVAQDYGMLDDMKHTDDEIVLARAEGATAAEALAAVIDIPRPKMPKRGLRSKRRRIAQRR